MDINRILRRLKYQYEFRIAVLDYTVLALIIVSAFVLYQFKGLGIATATLFVLSCLLCAASTSARTVVIMTVIAIATSVLNLTIIYWS